MTCCQDCGRKLRDLTQRLCYACGRKPSRDGVSIQHPTDDEMEKIFDGLIAQRSKSLVPVNRCLSEDPAEERMIRERLGI